MSSRRRSPEIAEIGEFSARATLGVSLESARRDHSHGSMANPIPAHVAEEDPHRQYQKESEKGQADGYASLDSAGDVPDAQIPANITRDSHDHTGGEGAQINHTTLSNIGTNTHAQIDSHIASTSNPHSTTLEQAAQAGATISTNVTFGGRAILPMAEVYYFDMTGTSVSIAAQSDGSSNMVKAAPASTFDGDTGFDNGGADNGRLRYTGTTTKMFHVACTITIAPDASNDVFVFGIAKNGSVLSGSKVMLQAINMSQARSTAMHKMVQLATNDYLELYLGNTTDADDCTVHSLNLFAMGM